MSRNLSLFLLLAMFALPVIVAKLMLDNNWYQGGVTNRGELLSQPSQSKWLEGKGQWQLIYLLPEHCEQRCVGALFNLRQIPQAIGAEQQRVSSRLLRVEGGEVLGITDALTERLTEQAVTPAVAEQMKALEFGSEAIYIADPNGTIMMAYPLVEGQSKIMAQGKDVLRDLKRLLKVSKIG